MPENNNINFTYHDYIDIIYHKPNGDILRLEKDFLIEKFKIFLEYYELKNQSSKKRQVFNDLDPYGEELWDE